MMIQELWLVHPDEAMCVAFRNRFGGLANAQVVQARFEELPPHDCFVTAGNSFGIMNAGIDAAVVRHFGRQLMDRVQDRIMDEFLGEQPVGTAFVVPTRDAAKPFVVHAPTMRVPGNIGGSDNIYRAAWAALLAIHRHNLSDERKIEIVAFPAFGTGFGGVTFDEAARQMAAAYRNYLEPPHRLDWDFRRRASPGYRLRRRPSGGTLRARMAYATARLSCAPAIDYDSESFWPVFRPQVPPHCPPTVRETR